MNTYRVIVEIFTGKDEKYDRDIWKEVYRQEVAVEGDLIRGVIAQVNQLTFAPLLKIRDEK